MGIFNRRQDREPEVKLDFSDIAETYRWSDETELEPGQELALFRGLGLTALRQSRGNEEYRFYTELVGAEGIPEAA